MPSGRGIWRCLYDQVSSLLITGGFDSAIKVRRLCGDPTEHNKVLNDVKDRREIFTISAPKVSQQPGLMDSKSEYIRCLHFTRENTLYVATNNGYLHRVELSDPEDVRWTELARVSKEVPIVCMDLIVSSEFSFDAEDMVAIGDGNGNVTVTKVTNNGPTYKVASSFTWSAEKERQLLGIFWCKSLGCGHLFTTDPRGVLKLWKIGNALLSDTDNAHLDLQVCHVAIFRSCFGARIVCLDASIENEILICGDQRGNLTLYSLPEGLIANSSKTVEILPLVQFKGAHGISSITSILVASLNFDHVELRTTGGDGCICYFKYYKTMQRLEFTGMRKLTELSTIQSIFASSNSEKFLDQGNYAIGFTSADFIVWDLKTEIKMLQIPCGGWRRSYSYHLGPVPEYQNCFAYLKDHIIHIHRLWVPANERKTIAQILHMQCHGREIHSLCFISSRLQLDQNESYLQTEQNESYLWTATGCEDGTVRLTRCMPIYTGSCESKLLGEHVGGSAVRSVYFTSKTYTIGASQNCQASPDSRDEQFLLISVGAKQVLTSWILRYTELDAHNFTPISFQWLSTHMPPKFSSTHRKVEKISESTENPLSLVLDQNENDWRYLAVTAFLVKHIDSRITVCFIVVSCSDATLILKALLLPYRLWFDVALLVPQTSPVLALQHLVVPGFPHLQDIDEVGNIYIVVSGATDGSITFWDLTETVEYFMKLVLELQPETLIDSQKRPQTGRGSQGGRWWRTLRNPSHDEGSTVKISPGASCMQAIQRKVQPLHVLNSIHQSGVNCLHVSRMKGHFHSESETVHCLVSGGDDQALHCLVFDLIVQDEIISHSLGKGSRNCNYKLRALFEDKINSAHSSAVKGIWTDGIWAFSTGLDQRVRCWRVGSSGRLAEHAHMIISVPEPEALDAVYSLCTYHIAVAGRGMQTVEFCAS